ncbi:hypothetical protein D7Z54_01505 [Salibacterium salarium]|uniref:Uncharacterized protein n=1 Tax=Salibacterium salarium TaxID=284579 RepID=A0A428NAB8_9BACI|nr:hypothetical protein [Salibacterium salarium]RSL35270.1 hypothetical protein D7Z54_01505 [Salibacterium salarium]
MTEGDQHHLFTNSQTLSTELASFFTHGILRVYTFVFFCVLGMENIGGFVFFFFIYDVEYSDGLRNHLDIALNLQFG